MTVPRKVSRRGSESLRRKNACQYVVPESEIHDFVGSLRILDITTHAARFQVVAELTSGAFEDKIDKLDQSSLRLIEQMAREDDSEQFRLIMKAINAGVRQGRHGINAAHLTASRTVELAFRWTREYFSALSSFRLTLSEQRLQLPERPSRRRAAAIIG
ncbi:MAG: hypothetical protein AABO41_28515 [Acidobacteriota bacterium]